MSSSITIGMPTHACSTTYRLWRLRLAHHRTGNRVCRRALIRRATKMAAPLASFVSTITATIQHLQGGAEVAVAFLETAPPPYYLIYLLAAGLGLPCSEDAFVAWVGANMANGLYGSSATVTLALVVVYIGVISSDMVTFGMGLLLRKGFFRRLRDSLMRDSKGMQRATDMIRKWSRLIGLVQRFSLGFRGPLCLVCGFTGVSAKEFGAGVALGALGTMPLQLFAGYLLRHTPNPYLAALAVAAGPNIVGHIVGPLATAGGFIWAGRQEGKSAPPSEGGASQPS